jgi:hypothetical protein
VAVKYRTSIGCIKKVPEREENKTSLINDWKKVHPHNYKKEKKIFLNYECKVKMFIL